MGNLTVSINGFVANGQPWNMRGLNASVDEAILGFPGVRAAYPGMTALRLNVDPGNDSAASIAQVVQTYTSAGIAVMIEDHWGTTDSIGWYRQMAQTYKDNSMVILETPNEPFFGDVAATQVAVIDAIRATGFTNPIGVQPYAGFSLFNIPIVVAAVGATNLFVTPHIYYGGIDPEGPASYVAAQIQIAASIGLYAVIDEFGDAVDGFNRDPFGMETISAVIDANNAGKAGAIFWAMDNWNHDDGVDSAFADASGSRLTPVGVTLQPWLSQPPTIRQFASLETPPISENLGIADSPEFLPPEPETVPEAIDLATDGTIDVQPEDFSLSADTTDPTLPDDQTLAPSDDLFQPLVGFATDQIFDKVGA